MPDWSSFFRHRSNGAVAPMTIAPRVTPGALVPPASPLTGKGKLVGTVGGAAAAMLLAIVSVSEGKRNDPYLDLVGKATVCYGETNVRMRRYSDVECEDMLGGSLAGYAKAVLERNPELRHRPEMLAATTSLTYNVGVAAYRRSTVAKRFSAGQWKAACDGFLAWSYAGGKQVKGLVNRRRAERALCLKGLEPPDSGRDG